jgi:hypothetical protein
MSQEQVVASDREWEIETVEDDPIVSVCLLSQCKGCELCQTSQVIEASERIQALADSIEDYEAAIDAARLELQHLLELRRLFCKHFWRTQLGRQLCPRCGKTQPAA